MKPKRSLLNKNSTYLTMIIPIVILFFVFNTLPLIIGAFYSFTNYRGYGGFDFVGGRNYLDLLTDTRVWNSYFFTFKYAIVYRPMWVFVLEDKGVKFYNERQAVVAFVDLKTGDFYAYDTSQYMSLKELESH